MLTLEMREMREKKRRKISGGPLLKLLLSQRLIFLDN